MIVMSILFVVIIILVVFVFLYQKSNSNANLNNVLFPFSAAIKPGDKSVYLKNAAGTSQIDCSSVGGKVNIVGAWVETIDPFGSCTGNSASVLNLTCGLRGAKIPCKQSADCGSGMTCSAGICTPSACPLTDDKGNFKSSNCSCGDSYCLIQPGTTCDPANSESCNDPNGTMMYCDPSSKTCQVNPGQNCMAPDPYTGRFCASYPLCSNVAVPQKGTCAKDGDCAKETSCIDGVCVPKNVVNKVCNPNGSCKPRDASAYLAAKCDGQDTCGVLFDPSDINSGFGPAPCANMNQNQLPITPGQGTNYNQGYYVHGLYTCIVPQ